MKLDINPPVRLLAAFQDTYPDQTPERIVEAPGRDMWVAADLSGDHVFTLIAPDFKSHTSFTWQGAKTRRTVLNRPLPSWARYPAGVILTLGGDGLDTSGVNAVFVGEEPSGPRYDYAVGMAMAALVHELNGTPYTAESLIEVVDRVRRDYIES